MKALSAQTFTGLYILTILNYTVFQSTVAAFNSKETMHLQFNLKICEASTKQFQWFDLGKFRILSLVSTLMAEFSLILSLTNCSLTDWLSSRIKYSKVSAVMCNLHLLFHSLRGRCFNYFFPTLNQHPVCSLLLQSKRFKKTNIPQKHDRINDFTLLF